ncbi:hypothetical protein SKAU_G00173830 [Synaphobranchus kaupii]|uniref:Uncharacterized protein n=1 Tax=Synaphobranchus kaupii TaxID=118154 RepID=A0A9Q1J0M5_SYNKA|nr:hypothetical protein SKAU_G00173830 [Synaphobranchus kaupii]
MAARTAKGRCGQRALELRDEANRPGGGGMKKAVRQVLDGSNHRHGMVGNERRIKARFAAPVGTAKPRRLNAAARRGLYPLPQSNCEGRVSNGRTGHMSPSRFPLRIDADRRTGIMRSQVRSGGLTDAASSREGNGRAQGEARVRLPNNIGANIIEPLRYDTFPGATQGPDCDGQGPELTQGGGAVKLSPLPGTALLSSLADRRTPPS